MPDPDPFTCPLCARISYNPHDAAHRFCGVCGFVDDKLAEPQARGDREYYSWFTHACGAVDE
jgi:hypothetical protein